MDTKKLIKFEGAKDRMRALLKFQDEFQTMFPELCADIEDVDGLIGKYVILRDDLNDIIRLEAKIICGYSKTGEKKRI
ncbi:hypothetical protein [Filifactor villosus]|uniref:Uncharacterized protein n=1 Tax=Filifactor villosus TaxID=29374 RepID=A0ABV9QQZ2_9FIRM